MQEPTTGAIALDAALKQFFGYNHFRAGQREVMEAILARRDALVVMPTGGGKSLCFQLPALLQSGLTIVVSPLIALMQDQVDALQSHGIAATFLNSSLSMMERRARSQAVLSGQVKLLYVAPERLLSDDFWGTFLDHILEHVGLSAIAIDEAHCVSEWGHDFRPEYRQLQRLRLRSPQVPILALTASATKRVREDIEQQLSLRNPHRYLGSFNRPNLFYEVRPRPRRRREAFAQLLQQLQGLDGSGIIYCLSRKRVDDLTAQLNHCGIRALPYHAGLGSHERTENQTRFIRDDVRVIVATIAFGMGINKPDVRFVIHYDLPRNIEGYYQESGRAGRDGEPAHCTLYFGWDDIKTLEWLITQKVHPDTGKPLEDEQRIAYQQLRQVTGYAESHLCRRTIQLQYFGENHEGNCGACDNCCHPKPLEDWTIDAQKFLSCVARCQEKFGMAHIISVLRGSRNEQVLNHGHDQLSTYGIGKDRSIEAWRLLGRTLLQQGLVTETPDGYSVLKLNAQSWEVLRKQRYVWVAIAKSQVIQAHQDAEIQDPETLALFQHLRQLRKHHADQQQVPPYVVFSDASLRAMAQQRPTNRNSFRHIPGVGYRKLDQYGQSFTQAIQTYCNLHALETDRIVELDSERGRSLPTAPPSTQLTTLALFRQGFSVEQIATQRDLKIPTIQGHLADLIAQGEAIDLDRLVTPERQAVIRAALTQFDDISAFKPIYKQLHAQYSYGELRLVLADLNRQTRTPIADPEI